MIVIGRPDQPISPNTVMLAKTTTQDRRKEGFPGTEG